MSQTACSRSEVQKALHMLREMGWPHSAIARECGVSIGTVDRWWSGTRVPKLPKALVLALVHLSAQEPPKKWRRGEKS